MFKRVHFEEFGAIITIIAFALCFATFIYFSIHALRMKKGDRDHMANLPLENEERNDNEKG